MALPLVSFLVPLGLMTGCKSSDKESGESLTNLMPHGLEHMLTTCKQVLTPTNLLKSLMPSRIPHLKLKQWSFNHGFSHG